MKWNPDTSTIGITHQEELMEAISLTEGNFKHAIDNELPTVKGLGVSSRRAKSNRVKQLKGWAFLGLTLEGTSVRMMIAIKRQLGMNPYWVWKAIREKYDPKEKKDILKMRRELQSAKMENDDDDPALWMLASEELNNRLFNVSETEGFDEPRMVEIHFLSLPKEPYKSLTMKMEDILDTFTWDSFKKKV